jgi:Uma2 family endonuclease
VPDVCAVRGNPGEQILTRPPLLCVEILSPDDSMSSMQERIDDYVAFGTENVWILDLRRKRAYWADMVGVHEVTDGVLEMREAPIRID